MDVDFYYVSRCEQIYYKGKIYIRDGLKREINFCENIREELTNEDFITWSKQYAKTFYGIDSSYFDIMCTVNYNKI